MESGMGIVLPLGLEGGLFPTEDGSVPSGGGVVPVPDKVEPVA